MIVERSVLSKVVGYGVLLSYAMAWRYTPITWGVANFMVSVSPSNLLEDVLYVDSVLVPSPEWNTKKELDEDVSLEAL